MKKMAVLLVCFVSLLFLRGQAWAASIDLNDFYDAGNVSIAPDGSSATMVEDPAFGSVFLSNDPSYGDPGIYIPADSMSLTFDYNFLEPVGNFDEFLAVLFDPLVGPITPLTDANGNDLEIFTDVSGSGTVTWDLLSAGFLGTTVGMEFQLNYDQFNDLDPSSNLAENSSVIISNVNVNPVPEPATLFLMGSGLAGFFAARKSKQKLQKNQ